jgi:hypothetical protein
MAQMLAPVVPMRPHATRTRKPDRRPGSCPSPRPTEGQLDFARRLIDTDRAMAAGIGAALSVLLEAPAS